MAHTCRRPLSAGMRPSPTPWRRHAKKRHACATLGMGGRSFRLTALPTYGSLLQWSGYGQFVASDCSVAPKLRQGGEVPSGDVEQELHEMKNSGNELKDVWQIKDLANFDAENELHFARKMMPNCAPRRAKTLHFAKNELQFFAPQASKVAGCGGLHGLRGWRMRATAGAGPRFWGPRFVDGGTENPRTPKPEVRATLCVDFQCGESSTKMLKTAGTNSTSPLESVKLEKNELETNCN